MLKRNRPNDLEYVATAPNEPIAMMWQEILENEGIHSMLKRIEPYFLVYMQTTFLPCEIYVLASDAAKARNVLAEIETEELQDNDGDAQNIN